VLLLALLTPLALLAPGAGCKRRPALDQQARDLVARLEQAAEEGNVEKIRALVAADFRGPDDLPRGPALVMLRARLRERPVHIWSRILSLEVAAAEGKVAVELVAAMAALPIGGPEDIGRLEADIYRWKLGLVVTDGELLVASASWEPARPLDFQ
jgi:hypothetical protein